MKDVELKLFRRRGLNDAEITIAAQIAEASGKMAFEIVNLRVDEKMSWAMISKKLSLHPQVLAQLLAQMRRPTNGLEIRHSKPASEPASRQAAGRMALGRQG